ncbi:MAG: hypothetical protein FWB84_08580 [Candidatus Bathyarchaeota archaeon]|uniref:hypothetical protein n=1 Tax=Candidatus Bathycorpusculum sp. TaxID=2994959 RepID=UPI0028275E9F|nr:hypothetical protein [Candidatus Termiticorpusculum sp.]
MNTKSNIKPKKSRMGFNPAEWKTEGVGEGRNAVLPKTEPKKPVETKKTTVAPKPTQEKKVDEKIIQATFYITKRQHKALKMKVALSDGGEDKDQSAIVRTAIDLYLAETLKQIK